MSKTQQQVVKKKTPKDMIKELEERLFGEKNKVKKKEIQGMIKKLELEVELDRKKKQEIENTKKNTIVKQIIPVGVDPKDVQCINFLNGNCDKGDKCQFGHVLKKEEKKEPVVKNTNKQKIICRFLIDAMNSGEYNKNWVCPIPKCSDLHKLTELSQNSDVEITLEEYIELQRQILDESALTPVTEKTFLEWKAKKEKEEDLHSRRVAALANNVKGADLFRDNPDMFEDDEEAGDEINYDERNYEYSDDENKDLEEE